MAKQSKFNDVSAKKKRKGNGTRVVLIVLIILLSLLLAVLVGGVVYVEKILGGINSFDTDSTMSSEELAALLEGGFADSYEGELGTEPENWDLVDGDEEMIAYSDDIINILLIGQDTRHANQKGLTDTLIVCTINTQTKKLVMTSFLRDMWVQIPASNGNGTYSERINTAYPVGGLTRLTDTLKLNFGVHVDHSVEIDFNGFKEIVDTLGGVDINLTAAEAQYINAEHKNTTNFGEGMHHLNGEQALTYARIRKIDSDFYRTNRQRTVLEALFEKVKNMNLTEANKLVNTFVPLITTDMDNSEIINYVVELLPLLPELEIITQRIPAGESTTDGYYQWANKGTPEEPKYVIVPILETNRELLKQTIGMEAN